MEYTPLIQELLNLSNVEKAKICGQILDRSICEKCLRTMERFKCSTCKEMKPFCDICHDKYKDFCECEDNDDYAVYEI